MVHLFLGCDDYLTSLKVAELKAALGDAEFADLNIAELPGDRTQGAEILAQASMMPFLSARRMVIVNGYLTALQRRFKLVQRGERTSAGGNKTKAQEDASDGDREETAGGEDGVVVQVSASAVYAEAAAFLLGLRHVPEHADLLLIDGRLDVQNSVMKGFRLPNPVGDESLIPGITKLRNEPGFLPHALVAPENRRGEEQLTTWILAEAQAKKIRIEPAAAGLLAKYVGSDLRRLGHELDKLSLFRPGVMIVEPQVRAQVTDTSEERFFALTDALVARNARAAFAVLADLWRAEENPFGLLGAIAGNYRSILRVKALMQSGTREPVEVAKALGLKKDDAWRAEKMMKGAKGFLSYSELESILERCFDTNLAMISGDDQATQIELLVADLTLTPARRAA